MSEHCEGWGVMETFSLTYIIEQIHFRPDEDWSVQSKCRKVVSELKLVTDNLLFIHQILLIDLICTGSVLRTVI